MQVHQLTPSSDIKIIYPDIHDSRIISVVQQLLQSGENPVICGSPKELEPYRELVKQYGLQFFQTPEGRTNQGYAAEKLRQGEVQGFIGGNISTTGDIVRALLKNLGVREGCKRISSYFLMQKKDRDFLFADGGLAQDPSPQELFEIVQLSVENALGHGILHPKVVLVDGGFENEKIQQTGNMIHDWVSEKGIDNVDVQIGGTFAQSYDAGGNVFIFHNLNAGNIAYKIAEKMSGYTMKDFQNISHRGIISHHFVSENHQCLFNYSSKQHVPDAEELMRTALESIEIAREKGIALRVAFLGYSTAGSGVGKKGPEASLAPIIEAASRMEQVLTDQGIHDVEVISQESQFDAAFIPDIGQSKGLSIEKPTTIYIFPDIYTGSICSQIPTTINGSTAIGPLIQGLAGEAHDVSRGIDEDTMIQVYGIVKQKILSKYT